MNRVDAEVISGSHNLVISESIICDDTEPLIINIPTTAGKPDYLVFEFLSGEVVEPQHTVEADGKIKVKLGSAAGAFLATKFKIPAKIAGKNYFYFFCLTRLVGKALRFEFSLYEQRGILK